MINEAKNVNSSAGSQTTGKKVELWKDWCANLSELGKPTEAGVALSSTWTASKWFHVCHQGRHCIPSVMERKEKVSVGKCFGLHRLCTVPKTLRTRGLTIYYVNINDFAAFELGFPL